MKMKPLFAVACIALSFRVALAHNLPADPERVNYVVIGVFSVFNHAVKFTEAAKQNNLNAVYQVKPGSGLFYVWILQTPNKKAAFTEAIRLRNETAYKDTWVFIGRLGDLQDVEPGTNAIQQPVADNTNDLKEQPTSTITEQPKSQPQETKQEERKVEQKKVEEKTPDNLLASNSTPSNNKSEEKKTEGKSGDQTKSEEQRAEVKTPVVNNSTEQKADNALAKTEEKKVEEKATPSNVAATTNDNPIVTTDAVKPSTAMDPNATSKTFIFKAFRNSGDLVDNAEVTVIDLGSQKKEYVFKANDPTILKPVNKSGDIRLECDAAGYRKGVIAINYQNPTATDGVTIEDDKIIVPFELIRPQKGDITVLYNVYFFKDAAIMRPESKYDLDGLLSMLQENQNYKIKIHGHTNGNASGRILELGDNKNYFSLSGAKEGYGSAKKLSEERALVIRQYMIDAGITPARMQVKAWGGRKPIYDKMHTQASANVRVEVEILAD